MPPRMLHACGWPGRIIWSSQLASVWEVRLYVYLFLFSSANSRQRCTANCHFRHTPPSSDWLDVSNTAHNSWLVSQLILCLYSTGHELTLFFLEFEVCTALPFCSYNHSQLCVLMPIADRYLLRCCAACQLPCPVRHHKPVHCIRSDNPLVQRRKIQLYGGSHADYTVSCHCSFLCVL